MKFLHEIPNSLIHLMLVVIFSLILGIEQHIRHHGEEKETFGTDRTFAFIGLLGYLLLMADTTEKWPYLFGYIILAMLLAVFYYNKIVQEKHYGITSIVLALLTYGFPLLLLTQPLWIALLFFVVVLILTELKKPLAEFSAKFGGIEFITFAKFIIISGIILPLSSDKQIASFIAISPYKIWLAVVVVSAISYLSYLLRKFIFPQAGLLLTGILGGMYSSTAATVILARKSKEDDSQPKPFAAAIVLATAMMFIRILIILFIFNKIVAIMAIPYFLVLFAVSLGTGFWLYKGADKTKLKNQHDLFVDKNPLEFKIAIIFAALYILFSIITQYTIQQFGQSGLRGLSVLVGFTDIDPFLLNLFQGHYDVANLVIAIATLQAAASNNILKLIYAWILSGHQTKRWTLKGFAIIIIINIVAVGILYVFK